MSKTKAAVVDAAADASAQNTISYEEAFSQLEQILNALELGELPLEESLALYEKGVQLASLCSQKLDDAEVRVRRWLPDGSTTLLD